MRDDPIFPKVNLNPILIQSVLAQELVTRPDFLRQPAILQMPSHPHQKLDMALHVVIWRFMSPNNAWLDAPVFHNMKVRNQARRTHRRDGNTE